jgi:hypothetical protein
MHHTKAFKRLELEMAGLGFIIYSPFAAQSIEEGEDFLESHFVEASLVAQQAMQGRIVGVSTGSGGRFLFELYWGYPESELMENFEYRLRLGVEVRDRRICFRDLYDLMDWSELCPDEQCVELDDGFYHITLLSNSPESEIIGDDQVICMYLNKLDEMPGLRFSGVPTLC